MSMSVRALALFIGSLLVAAWALRIAGLVNVGDLNSPDMIPYFIGAMFMPTLMSSLNLVAITETQADSINIAITVALALLCIALSTRGDAAGASAVTPP